MMKLFDTAIILAGGKSHRMGYDKQLIQINNELIVVHLAKQLSKHFSEIIVVTNQPDLYPNCPFRLIQDIIPGKGPLSGIHAGLSMSGSTFSYITACDMPTIQDEFIFYLKKLIQDHPNIDGAMVVIDDFIEPMNAVYRRTMVETAEESLENHQYKLRNVIDQHKFIKISQQELNELDTDRSMFQNLNYPEDVENFFQNNHLKHNE